METVFIQIRGPRGMDPGRVIESRYIVIDDTVVLVDPSGKPLTSDDKRYERKFAIGENTKQVAAQLLRQHYNAARGNSPRGFDERARCPKMRY